MLNQPQIDRMLSKLRQLEDTMEPYVFEKQASLNVKVFETTDQLYSPPTNGYSDIKGGDTWGKERGYCWFKSEYEVPQELSSQPLYIYPHFGGYEGLLFVNGIPYGNFAYKISHTDHGNHYCDLISLSPKKGEKIALDIEAYAGHYLIGTQPFESFSHSTYQYTFDSVDICTKNQDVADFIYDLRTLNQLVSSTDKDSFRRGDVINCLTEVHKVVFYSPEHTDKEVWRAALKKARDIMKPYLSQKNSASAPKVGIIGHSHMDTAWLWDISETVKKCARTYSNQMALMDLFPEYTFVQSSAYHLELMRRHYPELFEKIKARIKEGRYEPNGAVFVECDCNITGGESMVRQFLWGQKYTQKYFDFTSNAFWLPDTFGYSAAIPQIMKGCNVDYFLTTKMTWNDTTTFPYQTFKWQGVDGTDVFAHLNCIHSSPDPETLIGRTEGHGAVNPLLQKTVAKERLISYGKGDGGGGPEFEMVEMSRRCTDLEGCPKTYHTTVSSFMKNLEKNAVNPNTFVGELYLELHRGTLTNQHTIKRNNRKAEAAIRNAELLISSSSVADKKVASDKEIRPLLETLLVNQFHDILPGTCIPTAHDQSIKETTEIIQKANEIIKSQTNSKGDSLTLTNTLSFAYNDTIHINADFTFDSEQLKQQCYTDIDGNKKLAISGLSIPAFSSVTLEKSKSMSQKEKAVIKYDGKKLETPFAKVVFNEKGYIKSFIDKSNGRQLVSGYPFNTLLMAEDVPSAWDNWDIDADCQMKFADTARLLSEELVSNGEVELRIRRKYALSNHSELIQDMIFYTDNRRVDFETVIEWHDKRRFLKAAFDTTILSRQARHEIQFGNVCKPTTRNSETEQAMFEVVNHKYTDLSETQYGVSILNDCKYGISVEGGNMRLSLHKGGLRPDPRGDEGRHYMTYSFLPHNSGFSSQEVIKPAYMLNYPPIVSVGEYKLNSLVNIGCENVIVEAIKPCEENQKAVIVRLYEAEGTFTASKLSFANDIISVEETNLLEETKKQLKLSKSNEAMLDFKPFEIKTLKLFY